MAPYKTKRSVNAVELLNRRSRGTRDALSRYNLKVFRGVLLQDTRVFLKVWSKTSKSKIMYENGKFYFENYQICYSCVHSDPHVLYKLPKRSKKEKLEDALLCQSPLAGIVNNTIMHIAIFQAFPLQIVGIMEINKRVFGNGITDVVLSQGVLAVSYSNKSVKLYSCEHIFQRYITEELTLGKQSSLLRGKTVGEFPFGIPVNIQIKDCPPVLFEVSCSNNGVQVGGFPWHYIYTPPQKNHKGTHHIRSLKDNIMATNGIQNMNCCSLESDMIFFHPDDSGRIIHFGPNTINVLKILGELNSSLPSKIVKDFSMTVDRQNRNPTPQVTVTSSGRTVKRRVQQLDDDPDQKTFRLVEYEDELDLLTVLVTNGEEEQGIAHVQLHDNQSGKLLRTVELAERWDETYRHELFFDKDTIVHIEQQNTNFCCHVYKLEGLEEYAE
ncbi:DDB1- and CUL4-associated factor 17 isoform X2 [Sphaeramia orbicularis]|uniref:DDB1- and CUL4-associated factor 17 isoform X2 n=1 Tax=Sphaeramia orbicularis TaxID=375764 RepID=UPI00117CF578|nr:DDB1- and CUL4-associated factor 17 isoform X2 [Sphaeramia orbicularis]